MNIYYCIVRGDGNGQGIVVYCEKSEAQYLDDCPTAYPTEQGVRMWVSAHNEYTAEAMAKAEWHRR